LQQRSFRGRLAAGLPAYAVDDDVDAAVGVDVEAVLVLFPDAPAIAVTR
jgi:hypothetical protein